MNTANALGKVRIAQPVGHGSNVLWLLQKCILRSLSDTFDCDTLQPNRTRGAWLYFMQVELPTDRFFRLQTL